MVRRRRRPTAISVGMCAGILLVIAAIVVLIGRAVDAPNVDVFEWMIAFGGIEFVLWAAWDAIAARRRRD